VNGEVETLIRVLVGRQGPYVGLKTALVRKISVSFGGKSLRGGTGAGEGGSTVDMVENFEVAAGLKNCSIGEGARVGESGWALRLRLLLCCSCPVCSRDPG